MIAGIPVNESWLIPRDQVVLIVNPGTKRRTYTVHPSTMLRLRCGGRFPLWTRHSRGMIELDRDRRRYG